MEFEIREAVINGTLSQISDRPILETLNDQLLKFVPKDADYDLKLSEILDELEGFGPIKKAFENSEISEILIDGPGEIFIEKNGGLELWPLRFTNTTTLNRFVKNILAKIDRVADQRHPLVDGTLPDGSRIHIALPPITSEPIISIRRHQAAHFTLQDLYDKNSFSKHTFDILKMSVEKKRNILIYGATGTGKTTLLKALLNEVPTDQRIITVEDTQELILTRKNTVNLKSRPSVENLFPSVSLSDLLKNALRMRPDRLVVGEIRSEEALVFLDAVSTGHLGSMSSIHGSSAKQALARLEQLVSRSAPQWSIDSIRKLIFDGVGMIIGMERKNGSRQIHEVTELAGLESFGYLLNPL